MDNKIEDAKVTRLFGVDTMVAPDYPRIRAQHTCPGCGGSKNAGLLLCWTCHHEQKQAHDGSYSPIMEKLLAAVEARLTKERRT